MDATKQNVTIIRNIKSDIASVARAADNFHLAQKCMNNSSSSFSPFFFLFLFLSLFLSWFIFYQYSWFNSYIHKWNTGGEDLYEIVNGGHSGKPCCCVLGIWQKSRCLRDKAWGSCQVVVWRHSESAVQALWDIRCSAQSLFETSERAIQRKEKKIGTL